jgi:outer membrane lipoprotein SlyB
MRAYTLAMALVVALPLGACVTDDGGRPGYNHRSGGYDRDRSHSGYRQGHHRRQLRDNDRIYRGRDGHYYCKRDDGTTGTIVGALAGGVLGNIIGPGGSKTLGTVIGAVGGGVAGRAIDRNDVSCE